MAAERNPYYGTNGAAAYDVYSFFLQSIIISASMRPKFCFIENPPVVLSDCTEHSNRPRKENTFFPKPQRHEIGKSLKRFHRLAAHLSETGVFPNLRLNWCCVPII